MKYYLFTEEQLAELLRKHSENIIANIDKFKHAVPIECKENERYVHYSDAVFHIAAAPFPKSNGFELPTDIQSTNEYQDSLTEYINEGINWSATKNDVICCDKGNVEQFASDSFFAGFNACLGLLKGKGEGE